jgi:integrase
MCRRVLVEVEESNKSEIYPSCEGLREFRKITEAADLGTDWVPRELRHTFVSLLSSDGMPLEDIADLVGHKGTNTTETVYRKVIVPELRRGAEVMDRLFS